MAVTDRPVVVHLVRFSIRSPKGPGLRVTEANLEVKMGVGRRVSEQDGRDYPWNVRLAMPSRQEPED